MICLSDDAARTPQGQAMRAVFSAEASVLRILQFEAALARVQARRGLIPQAAADDITAKADLHHFPHEAWMARRSTIGHPLVAVLDAWSLQLAPNSRDWLHYGATTADLFNTILVLQLRQAADDLTTQLQAVATRLAQLCSTHRATPMVARTLGQHALPITFGMKAATWLAEHRRSIERLQAWRDRYRTGILSGAVGTYASFGEAGPAIEREVMAELSLDAPEAVDWKGSRDRFAEFGCVLALAARTCGHIGQEIFLLCGDDIGELQEGGHAVGSSTMPHKVNPSLSIEVISLSREVAAHLAPLMEWIPMLYDRDASQHGDALRDMCVQMADLAALLQQLLAGLVVVPQRMRANLERSGGQALSESVVFALAPSLGKPAAYALVKDSLQEARSRGLPVRAILAARTELRPLLDADPGFLDESRHVGLAPVIADAASHH